MGKHTLNISSSADGLGAHYVYDGLNRLVEIQYPDATVEYAYDALGRRTAMTDTAGVTSYEYDTLGRVIRVTDPFTGVVEYGYDLAGNRTALTLTHNAQPTTTHYAYDADNRLIRVTDWATGTTTYAYDPAGRLSATTLPNGVVTTHGYDPAGRLTDLTHTRGGVLLARYHYTLDATGNRTRVTETAGGVTHVISYTYDALYRLTAADYSTGEAYAYQYDSVGNREVMTVTHNAQPTTTHYTYDSANRLTSIQLPDSSIQGYTWDQRGNLLADGTFTYTYSAAGQMARAESITATLVYTYNADGLRVAQAQSVSSVESVDTFTWDWATPVPELLSDGESLYLIGYDTLGWQRGDGLAPSEAEGWTFVLPDALGSVRQETDAAGAVMAVREWSPYGEELGGAQAGLGFTGEWFDANVGLTYLRARWYAGAAGRFTSRDPWAGDTYAPISLHGYTYADNRPVNQVDPSGYKPEHIDQIGDIREAEIWNKLITEKELDIGYQYSCNCGWIDWGHAISGMRGGTSLAHSVLSRLKSEVDWSRYRKWTGERGVQVTSYDPKWGKIPIPGLNRVAIVSENSLNFYGNTYIGGSIFIAQSRDYEEYQTWFAENKFWGAPSESDFSEEDLPSNWVGFYMADLMQKDGYDPTVGEAPLGIYVSALQEIIRLCDLKTKEESRAVYQNEYLGGAGFLRQWRYFYPRLITTTPDKCGGGICNTSRSWPKEFNNLYNNSLRFSQEGVWWRWSGANEFLRRTPLEGVYAVVR